MYEILVYPDRDENLSRYALADRGRGLRLNWIRGARGNQVFTLQWEHRLVPFAVKPEGNLGPQPEDWVNDPRRWHIFQFGRTNWTEFSYGFVDDEERRQALDLAAEAIVVFGSNFNGPRWPDGYFTASFQFDGELYCYRLSDFGYPHGLGQTPRIEATR